MQQLAAKILNFPQFCFNLAFKIEGLCFTTVWIDVSCAEDLEISLATLEKTMLSADIFPNSCFIKVLFSKEAKKITKF